MVAIGKIVKPFGITGQVVVQTLTDAPSRFRRLRSVNVGKDEASADPFMVQHVVVEQRGVRLKLKGIDDRTAAEGVVGALLFVADEDRVPPPRGRFFIHDVIGMRVVDEIRGDVGVVHDVLKYPAHDVYVIERGTTSFMIPAVKEIVRRYDVAGKTLSVRLVEGMIDDEEGVVA